MLIKRKLTQNKMDSSKRRQSHERQLPITIVPYTRVRIDYALTRYEMNIERCKSISIFFSNALQNWNAQVIERCSLFVRFFFYLVRPETHMFCVTHNSHAFTFIKAIPLHNIRHMIFVFIIIFFVFCSCPFGLSEDKYFYFVSATSRIKQFLCYVPL